MVEEPQYMQESQKILAIPMKKMDKPPLMYLPLDSIKGLLDQPDRSTVQGKRDAVLLSLLYDTGGRVQELVDLKVCDITLNDTVTIILTGKGGKSRIIPVMKPTGELENSPIFEQPAIVTDKRINMPIQIICTFFITMHLLQPKSTIY